MATWPSTLPDPLMTGYELQATDPTIRTDMDAGSARVRRRNTATPDHVSLRFMLTEAQMAIFRAFWESDFMSGAAWVYMPIKDGRTASVSSKECRPVSGAFKSLMASATHWAVEFQVEVRNA